nr:hypothetical protein [Tanacetum cinerariifolium]
TYALPPHPAYRMTARISISAPVHVPAWSDSEVVRLLAMSSPPSSPLSPWEDRPEVTLPPQKRLDREIMRDPEREVGYGITDSWDEIVETLQGAPVSTDTELGGYIREFETRVRQDTDAINMRDYRIEDSPTRIGDSPTGIGDSIAGTGYRITWIAGTRWSLLRVTGSILASKALDYDVIL